MTDAVNLYIYNRSASTLQVSFLPLKIKPQHSEQVCVSLEQFGRLKDWLHAAEKSRLLSWNLVIDEETPTVEETPMEAGNTQQDRRLRVFGSARLADFRFVRDGLYMMDLAIAEDRSVVNYFTVRVVEAASPVAFSFYFSRCGETQSVVMFADEVGAQVAVAPTGLIFQGQISIGLSSLKEGMTLDQSVGEIEYAFCSEPIC